MQSLLRILLLLGGVFYALLFVGWCFRLTALGFGVLSLGLLVFVPSLRQRGFRWSALAVFVVLSLLPFDVSLNYQPGLPKVKRLVYGLPSKRTLEAARRDEVILGGCMRPGGYEPTWLLIW